MRKVSLLLAALLVLSMGAFAQEFTTGVAVEFEGSASATFGYDLEDGTSGFQNAASLDLTITFAEEQTVSTSGDAWYGFIEFEDMEVVADDSIAAGFVQGSITAKITNDMAYVKIWGKPSDSNDWASVIETASDPEGAADVDKGVAGTLTSDAGIIVGYGDGAMIDDISLEIISKGDWTVNADNEYGVVVNVSVIPVADLLTLNAAVVYSGFDAGTFGVSVEPVIEVADIAEGLELAIGFDYAQPDVGDAVWEADVEFNLDLAFDSEDDDTSYVALGFYYTEENADMTLSFNEETDGGLVDLIGATVDLRVLDLVTVDGDDLDWTLDVTAEYDDAGLNPYLGFGIGSDEVTDLNVGVNLEEDFHSIEFTTFTIDYATSNLDADTGLLTFMAEIAF